MISAWFRCARFVSCCLVMCAVLLQTGCTNRTDNKSSGDNAKVTKANFEKIKDKMPEKEVIELLGSATESKDIEGGKEHTWKSGNNRIQIGFKDGKVDYKSSQFVN
jgi:hypothetical protein